MNKLIIIWFSIVFLINCFPQEKIDENAIKIIRVGQHPFLTDHCKQLIIEDKSGKILAKEELYCDPGNGCNSYLFNTGTSFTLIDCNGQWFVIDKSSGQIKNNGWNWHKELPKKVVGVYSKKYGEIEYEFKVIDILTRDQVYKFKDPK